MGNQPSQPSVQTTKTKEKQPKKSEDKGFLSGLFFKQQNIGLNSVKQVSKTVDTNISKITQFFKQRQHYVQYFLYGSALFAVTFLSFYYQSIKVAKLNFFNTISRQKNNISKKSIATQAFNTENNFPHNNLKVFKDKVFLEKTQCYQQVMNHYKDFKQFTRYPLLLIGQNGVGKTELLRTIFHEVRDVQFNQITYVDVNVVTREAKSLSDILFFKYPEFKHYRKIFQKYSQEIKKPTILLDNFHLLMEFPQYSTILQDIEYYRWIESFNFLFASNYRHPQLSFKVNLIQKQFKGIMSDDNYSEFVNSLEFNNLKEQILNLKPNIYTLQDLYLCPPDERSNLLQSIKSRSLSQLQYHNIASNKDLKKLNNNEEPSDYLKLQKMFKEGLLRFDQKGKVVYGSEFLENLVRPKNK